MSSSETAAQPVSLCVQWACAHLACLFGVSRTPNGCNCTDVHLYVCCMHACMHACMHTCIHTCTLWHRCARASHPLGSTIFVAVGIAEIRIICVCAQETAEGGELSRSASTARSWLRTLSFPVVTRARGGGCLLGRAQSSRPLESFLPRCVLGNVPRP